MIILMDIEKASDKTPFYTKILNKLGVEGKLSQYNNGHIGKPVGNIHNNKRLKSFPLIPRTRQGYPLSLLLFKIVLEVLARAVRQNK